MNRPKKAAVPVLLILMVVLSVSCSTKPPEPEEVHTRRVLADSLMIQGYGSVDMADPGTAWKAFDQALKIYAAVDYREGTIKALLAMGRSRRMSGDFPGAEELYLHAQNLAVFSDNPGLMRSALNYRADLAIRQGNPVLALELLDDLEPEVTDGPERAEQLRLRATALYSISREDEAVSLLVESVEIALKADEPLEAAKAYYKLASIASLGARFTEAESWALKALEADKAGEYGPGIAADLRALAIISTKAGNQAQAEDYLRRSWLAWRGLDRSVDMEEARKELETVTGRQVNLP